MFKVKKKKNILNNITLKNLTNKQQLQKVILNRNKLKEEIQNKIKKYKKIISRFSFIVSLIEKIPLNLLVRLLPHLTEK